MGLFGCLEAILLILLVELLSSKTGLGDQALDLRALVESLILSFDFASDNIFANIIFPFFKSESLDDIVSSLGTKSVGTRDVSNTIDILLTLLLD